MKQAYLFLLLCAFTSVFSGNKDETTLTTSSFTTIENSALLPSATISGTATVCKDAAAVVITFTGSGEVAPYTFTYTINGGAPLTVTSTSNSVAVPVVTSAVGVFIYNLISVSCPTPGCTQVVNESATVTVVDISTATISASVNICPNNSASFTITGTPNALVVLQSSTNTFYTVTLNAAGTAVFTTPLLQETMTYTLISASLNGCNTPLTGSATANINSNGCATVLAGNVDLFDNIEPICEIGDTRQLTASYQELGGTQTYEVSAIPYCPQAAFFGPGFTPVSVNTDDVWSGDIPLPFEFCFFGNKFTTANVGSNGLVSFNSYPANSGSGYSFSQTIPNTTFPWKNAIYGVLQDTNPSQSPPEVSVNYQLMGNYPCRKLVINFYHLGQFSCGQSVGLQTYQIVIYEISNIIEVYVESRTPCNGWIGGVGLIGIQNAAGTLAYTPPNRNTGNWSATNEAWRFTPNGPSAVTFNWSDDIGTNLGSNTTIDVAPTATTTYTATAVYDVCGDLITLTKDVTVEVFPNETLPAEDLIECSNEFDLTQNTATILGPLDPNDYEIYYHTSLIDAENVANPIADPTAFISDGQQIWMSIQNVNAGGCIYIRDFQISPTIITEPSAQQNLCPNSDPAPFTVETTFTAANSIRYVYFTTPQISGAMYTGGTVLGTVTPVAGVATYDAPALGLPGSLPNVAGTYYVYAIANPTPTEIDCRPYQEIIVIVGDGGGATINASSTNICKGDSSTITFNAVAGTIITYTVNGGPIQTITVSATNNTLVLSNLQATTVVELVSATGGTGCSGSVTQTITINVAPLPTATISGTINVCQNSTNPLVTFTGASGVQPYTFTYTVNGGAPQTVTSPAGSNIATVSAPTTTVGTTTYTLVSVQNVASPNCTQVQTGSVTVTVRALPTATISGTASVCQNTTEPMVTFTGAGGTAPYTFTYDLDGGASQTVTTTTGNSISIPVSTATVGIINVNLLNVSDSSASSCSQAQIGTVTITIGSPPAIFNPTPLEVCDDNYDGLAAFNLTTKNDEITGGAALTVEYFETSTSATPITNLTNYQILNPNTYTLYVHVFDPLAPECFSTTTLQLIVNKKPAIAPISAYPLCETSIPADGIESFDLSTKTAEIINGQANIGVTYYTTQALAQAGVAGTEINSAVPYDSPSAVIWVRLENNITNCFAVTSFNLIVNPRPDAFEPAEMNGCSNGIVNTASFDLTLNNPEVTGGVGGVVVTYHLTLQDAEADANALPIPYVSGPAIIFIRVENTATGCFNTTQVQLNVTQGPTANTPTPLQVCDPNSDGFSTFNLADANEEISGGPVPAGVTITYHETETDAQFGENPQPSIYDNNVAYNQTIWVNVSYTLTGCSNIVELQLIVNNTPVATEIPALEVCDNNADGFAAFDLTTAVAGILNTLDPTTHAVTFYPTQADAQAATNVITNTTAFVNTVANTQTIWVRVENTVTGCFDVISLDLIVNALPLVATPIPAYTLCDVNNPGDQKEEFDLQSTIPMILNGQDGMEVSFYFDQANAQAKTNALPFLYTNVSNAQTIWVRVENLATGCFVLSRMDLRIEPLPVLYPPTSAVTECDQDGNGFASFDLDALVADLLQGEPNTTVTFHLTEQDALTSSNGQTSPFDNTTAFVDFIWVRAENTVTGCFSVLAIELNVVAAPKIPALDPIVKCDEDSNPQDGRTTFDLTVQSPIIIAAQIGAGPYTVTYYTTEANATAGLSPIIQDTFYINTTNPQTIWVRVDDANSDCFAVKSFEISVNLPILLTRPAPLSLCDDGPTTALPQTVFDLTVKNDEITNGAIGYTIVYYPSYADALAGTNAITDPTAYTNIANAQTLGVAVTSAEGCISYTTMDIRVLPLPTPLTDLSGLDIEGCEDTVGSGEGIFDLTQNEDYISDEDPNLVFEYYLSEQDAIDGVNAIVDPTNYTGPATTIWIKVMNASLNYLGDACYVIIQQNIVINPLPVLNDPTEYLYCDIGATGTAEFTLNLHNDQVLEAGQNVADYTFAYYLNQADAEAGINQLSNLYTNITNPQDIVVAVTHGTTSCKSYAVVTLRVAEGAIATTPTAYASCDTDEDGILIIDLDTLFSTEILGAQAAPQFTVSYYPTLEDAQAGTNAIDPSGAYPASTSVLYAAVNNTTTGCRSLPVMVNLTIEALPKPVITADNPALCVDFVTGALNSGMTLDSGLDPALYTFEWSLDGVVLAGAESATYSITTDAPGVYSVIATSVSALSCPSAAGSFTVIKSGPAVLVGSGYTVSNAFNDNQTLTITVEGFGSYEYSLDGGPWVANDGIFENITPGAHTVEVRDINSCGPNLLIEDIYAINYPHFFTPNGDGINDTWNITTLKDDLSAKIYIFDRYGKLLKEISPRADGWNGTFNGKLLPSSDYWFKVLYTENGTNKEFKAHFSLKR